MPESDPGLSLKSVPVAVTGPVSPSVDEATVSTPGIEVSLTAHSLLKSNELFRIVRFDTSLRWSPSPVVDVITFSTTCVSLARAVTAIPSLSRRWPLDRTRLSVTFARSKTAMPSSPLRLTVLSTTVVPDAPATIPSAAVSLTTLPSTVVLSPSLTPIPSTSPGS
jgi:hypothetical protein